MRPLKTSVTRDKNVVADPRTKRMPLDHPRTESSKIQRS
jgi:hypothetical protein